MRVSAARVAWIALGWIALALAVIGAVLPILPTTPFVLAAGFCFSRGSTRLHRWLLTRKTFGPMLRDWEQDGAIRRRVKVTATAAIVLTFGLSLLFVPVGPWHKAGLMLVGALVLVYIWTRPEV